MQYMVRSCRLAPLPTCKLPRRHFPRIAQMRPSSMQAEFLSRAKSSRRPGPRGLCAGAMQLRPVSMLEIAARHRRMKGRRPL